MQNLLTLNLRSMHESITGTCTELQGGKRVDYKGFFGTVRLEEDGSDDIPSRSQLPVKGNFISKIRHACIKYLYYGHNR